MNTAWKSNKAAIAYCSVDTKFSQIFSSNRMRLGFFLNCENTLYRTRLNGFVKKD